MFTGLIEAVCTVTSASRLAAGMELTVNLAGLADDVKIGDSIAISGTCLTITNLQAQAATFDVSDETLSKSNLSKITPSSQVNVERALRLTDRLGGHIVQGHIDATATIKTIDISDIRC